MKIDKYYWRKIDNIKLNECIRTQNSLHFNREGLCRRQSFKENLKRVVQKNGKAKVPSRESKVDLYTAHLHLSRSVCSAVRSNQGNGQKKRWRANVPCEKYQRPTSLNADGAAHCFFFQVQKHILLHTINEKKKV